MKIGDRLKKFREMSGMQRKEAAEKIGVKPGTLAHWENGVNEPNIETLTNLSKIYNVSISEIFGEEPNIVDTDTKNTMLDKVIDMLIEEGSLSGKDSFDDLEDTDKRIIISVIDKFIANKKTSN
jgi:HTH-type transcriptional regulator, cell division transcriptional repressor